MIDPTAAAPYTKPSAPAEACRLFLTRSGSSTYRAAGPTMMIAEMSSVAQSHFRARTNANPSRNSRLAERSSRWWNGRGVSANAVTVETTKVAASATNAVPTPALAIRIPEIAGPITFESGRTNWSSEFASTSSSFGTISGTIEPNAGAKSASPTPVNAASTPSSQSPSWCETASTPIVPTETTRIRSATIISFRRSKRSVRTPPPSSTTAIGSVLPGRAAIQPSVEGRATSSSRVCQASATSRIPSPMSDTVIPVQSSAKSRIRSGASIRGARIVRLFRRGVGLGSCRQPEASWRIRGG